MMFPAASRTAPPTMPCTWLCGSPSRIPPVPPRGRHFQPTLITGVVVVPVRQRPILWSAGHLCDHVADDGLKGCKVSAVPWQKEPGLMLALVPGRRRRSRVRKAASVIQISGIAPGLFVGAVHSRQIAPAVRLGEWALKQRIDGSYHPAEASRHRDGHVAWRCLPQID
jgi:hypothetical protein